MQVADQLFYARGLHAVGIDEIIAKSGAAKATLYAHFATKDDLIAAYLQQRSDAWRDHLGTAIDTYADRPRERMDAIFRVLAEGVAEGFQSPHQRARNFRTRHPAPGRGGTAAPFGAISAAGGFASRRTRTAVLYDSALVGSQLAGTAKPATRARDAARVLVAASGPKSR